MARRASAAKKKTSTGRKGSATRKKASGAKKRGTAAKKRPASAAKPARKRSARRTPARSAKSDAVAPAPPRAASGTPNRIGFVSQHVDFTSHAMDEVQRFYGDVLGFAGAALDQDRAYLLVPTGAGSSIGFTPPRPVPPEQWRPPREPSLYFIVEDLDRVHRELVARGVEFEQVPVDMPHGHRVAVLRDPEGRAVCLAEVIQRSE